MKSVPLPPSAWLSLNKEFLTVADPSLSSAPPKTSLPGAAVAVLEINAEWSIESLAPT